MTKKQKRTLLRSALALLLFGAALLTEHLWTGLPTQVCFLLYIPAYLVIGIDVLFEAARNVLRGRVLDEELLMTVATVGALIIGEYPEAVFVMIFFRVGALFEATATDRARRAVAALAEICPDTARLLTADGEEETDAEDVVPGSLIRVLPGERVPLDGVVTEGRAALDLSALTGEALPAEASAGTEVAGGCVALDGSLIIRVTRPASESTAARILEMVENATDRKARVEGFITRFSRVYTPTVCALAVLAAVIPLFFGVSASQSVYAALSFLVISCPCALVISVPLSFFVGIGAGARAGILFKGSLELERLAAVRGAAFDKTGTLTHGTFEPTDLCPAEGVTEEDLLSTAAAVEAASTHPIARSVVKAYRAAYPAAPLPEASNVLETAGKGIAATVRGARVLVGNVALLLEAGVDVGAKASGAESRLYVARNGALLGSFAITDVLREEAAGALCALKRLDIRPLVLLSGDKREIAEAIGAAVGADRVYAPCLPAEKASLLEKEKRESGRRFLYIGDGINDAPTLALSDCGVAMGALGTDAAVSAADVVLLRDSLSAVPDAVRLSRRTVRIARENIIFSLAVKALVMVLSFLGFVGMWAAVFADVGVSVLAILNAMRAARR